MLEQMNSFMATGSDWKLENQLLSALNPVKPDPLFVNRLEERLRSQPATVLEPGSLLGAYLVMASGLFGGVLLIWLLHLIFYGLEKLVSQRKPGN